MPLGPSPENSSSGSPSRPRRRGVLRAVLAGGGGASLILFGYFLWFGQQPLQPGEELYRIDRGMTVRHVSRELYRRGVLPDPWTLVVWAYVEGSTRRLKAGEYRFPAGITPRQLLARLVDGRVVSYPLKIIEGWTFRQVLAALARAPKLEQRVAGLAPAEIMDRLGHPGLHPEGRFYPDTYHYSAGDSDLALLHRAFDLMEKVLAAEWRERDPATPLQSADEALILASIIEKETARADERSMIAGVFINRLRQGMRLQTDPTVIYGIGPGFDGNLRRRDLRADTPYNTYLHAGLPPTPIALPGREAIHASLHPADTRALYFVARGDGSHAFSATLREHNAAVIKYQLGGRARRFSSHPAPRAEGQAAGEVGR